MRNSFIFYRSFFEAINDLQPLEQAAIYRAIADLALNQKETELTGLCRTVMTLIRPQIEANHKKSKGGKYGKLGGRPAKNKPIGLSQEKPIGLSENNPNVNDNVNVNDNSNVNINGVIKEKTPNKLVQFIKDKYPNISKLKYQLTDEEAERLTDTFSKDLIWKTLDAMENKSDLSKKYTSVNLTLRNWMKRELAEDKAAKKPEVPAGFIIDEYGNKRVAIQGLIN